MKNPFGKVHINNSRKKGNWSSLFDIEYENGDRITLPLSAKSADYIVAAINGFEVSEAKLETIKKLLLSIDRQCYTSEDIEILAILKEE